MDPDPGKLYGSSGSGTLTSTVPESNVLFNGLHGRLELLAGHVYPPVQRGQEAQLQSVKLLGSTRYVTSVADPDLWIRI